MLLSVARFFPRRRFPFIPSWARLEQPIQRQRHENHRTVGRLSAAHSLHVFEQADP